MSLRSSIAPLVSQVMPPRVKREVRTHLNRIDFFRDRERAGYRPRSATSSIFHDVAIDDVLAGLERDGIWSGFRLPEALVAALRDWCARTPVYGNRKPDLGFLVENRAVAQKRAPQPIGLACYFNTYEDCEPARSLATDPLLTEIAMRYVGPRCKSFGTTIWWTFPNDTVASATRDDYAQRFHYDLDARRFLKFFFYLHDVDMSCGPHVFVAGTHKNKPARHLWPKRRLDDDDVERTYGKDAIRFMTGRAGDGFAEDTFGLHKGTAPAGQPRLVLQLEYGVATDECRIDASDRSRLRRIDV